MAKRKLKLSPAGGIRALRLYFDLSKAGLAPGKVHSEILGIEQSEKASRPRGQRPPRLWKTGLRCLLDENPELSANDICSWLEGVPRTYEDEDIEVRLEGEHVVVRDLATDEEEKIAARSLRSYLHRARNS